MTEVSETTETPSRGIDPAGDVGLVLMALSQLGVAKDYLERIETAVTRLADDLSFERQRHTVTAEHLTAARTEQDRLRERVERGENAATTHERNLRRFKDQVRAKAIEVAASEGWCEEGLNEALSDLGLDPVRRSYHLEGVVTYTRRKFSWDIEAGSKDEAKEMLERLLEDDDSHSAYDDDHDMSVEFTSVEPGEML